MPYRVAILWCGDCEARRAATPQHNRYHRIFEELAVIGIRADPAVFDEEFADEVHEQLLTLDGVLVWVDPISRGKTRTVLDAILRDVAARGPWVSAHPDVIMKMGVKEALHRTKYLGWGTDTYLYRSAADFRAAFPSRLQSAGPRVLKQNRGNDGQGVWKVELLSKWASEDAGMVSVLQALRGSIPEQLPIAEFMTRSEVLFRQWRSSSGPSRAAIGSECRAKYNSLRSNSLRIGTGNLIRPCRELIRAIREFFP